MKRFVLASALAVATTASGCNKPSATCPPCPVCPGASADTTAAAPSDSAATPEPMNTAAIPATGPVPMIGGCRIFPANNPWNMDVSGLPLDPELNKDDLTEHLSMGTSIHLDFGTTKDHYGIPITVGKAAAPAVLAMDDGWPEESDKLACPKGKGGDFCYPIPLNARIEGGPKAEADEDRHIIFLATDGAPDHCTLYETYSSFRHKNGFKVKAAAIWKLDSNARRKDGFTSADAGGLPILPGLVRAEEVQKGEIKHAVRFTLQRTAAGFIYPATHASGVHTNKFPPLGMRVRLKASFDTSGFSGPAKVLVTAMKKYGMILADNGTDWYVSGEESDAWGNMDDFIGQMKKVKGRSFEIVKTGKIIKQAD